MFSRSLLLSVPESLGANSRPKELLNLKTEYKGDELFSAAHSCSRTPSQH